MALWNSLICVLLVVYLLSVIANEWQSGAPSTPTETPLNLWHNVRKYYQNRSALTLSERGNFGAHNNNHHLDSDRIVFVEDQEEENKHLQSGKNSSEKCNNGTHPSGGGGSGPSPAQVHQITRMPLNPIVKNEYHRNESTGEYRLE